jgi:photosystem II stability/assembly factor-like uncharacterized protein
MKRLGFVLAIALLGAGLARGQYGYQYMSGGYWSQAQFIGQEGWMVGSTGQVLHTVDGGRTWVLQPLPDYPSSRGPINRFDLGGVCFVDRRHGWVSPGEYSPYLWRTGDGGTTWEPESVGNNWWCIHPAKIAFADTLHGWLVSGWVWDGVPIRCSGDIFATTDGGRSWTRQDSSRGWFGVWAATPRQSWTVGWYGWAGRTTDGGVTWLIQQITPDKTLYGITFYDTLQGWACGDIGTIVHTTDGGITWALQASGTTSELYAITFLDRIKGFAVGDSGTLLTTTDGGTTWASIPTGVSAALTTLSFGDSLYGWAIGEGGTTVETSDGGLTWRVTRQGTTERLQAVSFVDDQTGWAASCEGNIWHTEDGGRNWSRQISGSRNYLRGLTMANAQTGWAVGTQGLILATQNGGETWAQQYIGIENGLWGVLASDARHAWACGARGSIVRTTNGGGRWDTLSVTWPDSGITGFASVDSLYGWALFWDGSVWATTNCGKTWGRRNNPWLNGWDWRHLSFVDTSWGWAVGRLGIRRSTDGGRTWWLQSSFFGMNDVAGVTRMKAWAVGDSGRILVTTNGGTDWLPQASPVTDNLVSVSFADTLHGIAACGGAVHNVLVTRNGGAVWDTTPGWGWFNKDVFLVDTLNGWRVNGGIFRTTDGGYNWEFVRGIGDTYGTVHFANRDTGWVGSGNGLIFRTTDGGETWDSVRTLTYGMVKDIRLANGRIGWCSIRYPSPSRISNSELKVSFDRGDFWSSISEGRVEGLDFKGGGLLTSSSACFIGTGKIALRTYDDFSWDLSPLFADTPNQANPYIPVHRGFSSGDGRTGWAVGRFGSRVITTDGGLSWRLQKRPDTDLLASVKAFDGQTARATGYLGRSVLTTDGGATWVEEERGTREFLLGSSFLTPTLGWVAGDKGMVLKYGRLPSGMEEEREQTGMPLFTWLGQNRPNPFSGGTEIKYQLASKGKVRLVVYNVLGQAVRKLVVGKQEAGSYLSRWGGKDEAGRNASSGVYFYRLEASGQSQTRKMVKIQ